MKGYTSLAAKGALAQHVQRRTACNTSLPAESKMADGSGNLRLLDLPITSLNKFFDSIIPSMRTSKIKNGH